MSKKIFIVIVLIAMLLNYKTALSNIVINEIMSRNNKTLLDEDREYSDWVELYNIGDTIINLKGWTLTDVEDNFTWKLPEFYLSPSCFVIIYCSGKNKASSNQIHSDFKLKSEGENLYLYTNQGELADFIPAVNLTADISFGRLPDGNSQTVSFLKPTPGQPNIAGYQLNEIKFSHKPGYYDQNFMLTINQTVDKDKIYYTTDGSVPTLKSIPYDNGINVKSKNGSPNIFSMIRTNPAESPDGYRWKPPAGEVFKATTIRAASFNDSIMTSQILSSTYIIDPKKQNRYSFPVVSIITDSTYLFAHNNGIYVPGVNYEENPDWTSYWGTGNYHQTGDAWERPAHIEYFEEGGSLILSQDAGIRIHGSGGCALPEKSLRLYAREEFGVDFFYHYFFKNKNKADFKRLLLRNSGQDFLLTMFADALIQDLSRDLNIEISEGKPVICFINGEYWGIHNLSERYDEYYLQDYCGLSIEDIELFDNIIFKDPRKSEHFNEMYEFILTNDISNDLNFERVSEYLDINNTINYFIQKIYTGTWDWPGNNVKIWRPKIPGAKWRWLSLDNDDGLMYPELNSLIHATSENSDSWRNPAWSTFIFRNLMKNSKFRQQFIGSLDLKVRTVFKPEVVIKKIDDYEYVFSQEIEEHIRRWNYPKDLDSWHAEINRMRDFAKRRVEYLPVMINDYLNSTDVEDVIINLGNFIITPNPNDGNFILNLTNLNEIEYTLQITDLFGNMIYNNFIQIKEEGNKININLADYSSGLYIVKLIGEKTIYTNKICIYH